MSRKLTRRERARRAERAIRQLHTAIDRRVARRGGLVLRVTTVDEIADSFRDRLERMGAVTEPPFWSGPGVITYRGIIAPGFERIEISGEVKL